MNFDLPGESGGFRRKYLLGFLEDDRAPLARGDAAQNEDVLESIEFGALQEAISEVDADTLEDGARPFVARLEELLHGLELGARGVVRGELDARARRKPDDGVLRKVIDPRPSITGPFAVDGSLFSVIERGEGELVEPAGDVALLVDVAAGEARPHGDAEHGLIVQAHRSGERRHVTVVGDFDRHVAPFLGDIEVEGLDTLLEKIERDLAEQRGHARLVVDVNARRADADRVDSRQVLGGAADRIVDAVEVILRVAVEFGLPYHLAREDFLSIDHGGNFAIAAPRIEADAVALEVASNRRRALLFEGEARFIGRGHLEAVLVDVAHEFGVERPLAPLGIRPLQMRRDVVRSEQRNFRATFLPEQKLQEAFGIGEVVPRRGVAHWKRQRAIDRDAAVRAL